MAGVQTSRVSNAISSAKYLEDQLHHAPKEPNYIHVLLYNYPPAISCLLYMYMYILSVYTFSYWFYKTEDKETKVKCGHQHTKKPLIKNKVIHTDDKYESVVFTFPGDMVITPASIRSRYRYYPSTLRKYMNNRLHSAWKYARIFGREHYMFREENVSFPRP